MAIPTEFNFLVNVAAQIPIVAIFIWFAITQQKIFMTSQEKRDEAWRLFLEEQRKANNEALGRIAEEVKENNTLIRAGNK